MQLYTAVSSVSRNLPVQLLQVNQSIILFVQMQNKHWTGHQGRMQPPLTGAHKNNVSKSDKRQYFAEKKNLADRKMFKSNIHHKTQQ